MDDLEEFDFLLGRFPRRNWSPTEIEMENSTILKFSNKSFDFYFTDMKKRNYQKGLHTANTGLTYKIHEGLEIGTTDADQSCKVSAREGPELSHRVNNINIHDKLRKAGSILSTKTAITEVGGGGNPELK